jgi:hypothetical protein
MRKSATTFAPTIAVTPAEETLESKARRAAMRVGLFARKSRWGKYWIDNCGEFMLINPYAGGSVAGHRFDMTAEEVIAYCMPARHWI